MGDQYLAICVPDVLEPRDGSGRGLGEGREKEKRAGEQGRKEGRKGPPQRNRVYLGHRPPEVKPSQY